jgi:hypothetical protein
VLAAGGQWLKVGHLSNAAETGVARLDGMGQVSEWLESADTADGRNGTRGTDRTHGKHGTYGSEKRLRKDSRLESSFARRNVSR